jgi:hypothetical protein
LTVHCRALGGGSITRHSAAVSGQLGAEVGLKHVAEQLSLRLPPGVRQPDKTLFAVR